MAVKWNRTRKKENESEQSRDVIRLGKSKTWPGRRAEVRKPRVDNHDMMKAPPGKTSGDCHDSATVYHEKTRIPTPSKRKACADRDFAAYGNTHSVNRTYSGCFAINAALANVGNANLLCASIFILRTWSEQKTEFAHSRFSHGTFSGRSLPWCRPERPGLGESFSL